MAINPMNSTVRRLTTAEGFLDLELPKLALEELDRIEEPGPLRIPYLWLKAAAFKADGRPEEAAVPLRLLAQCLPASISQKVQQSLAECLGQIDPSAHQNAIEPASADVEKPALETPAAYSRTLQINIPHVGLFSLKVVGGQSLTISIERTPAAPGGDNAPRD